MTEYYATSETKDGPIVWVTATEDLNVARKGAEDGCRECRDTVRLFSRNYSTGSVVAEIEPTLISTFLFVDGQVKCVENDPLDNNPQPRY